MKLVSLALVFLVGACADVVHAPQAPIEGDTSNLLIYYSGCEGSQPSPGPTWCDVYEDGASCCTWDKHGFHEEWCQYPDDWCWQLNGMWR